jgi:hypothetical protein
MKFWCNPVPSLSVYLSMDAGNWQKLAKITENPALTGVDTAANRQ